MIGCVKVRSMENDSVIYKTEAGTEIILVLTNEEYGIAALVGHFAGTYSVAVKDVDAGEFAPCAVRFTGAGAKEKAIAVAQKAVR